MFVARSHLDSYPPVCASRGRQARRQKPNDSRAAPLVAGAVRSPGRLDVPTSSVQLEAEVSCGRNARASQIAHADVALTHDDDH